MCVCVCVCMCACVNVLFSFHFISFFFCLRSLRLNNICIYIYIYVCVCVIVYNYILYCTYILHVLFWFSHTMTLFAWKFICNANMWLYDWTWPGTRFMLWWRCMMLWRELFWRTLERTALDRHAMWMQTGSIRVAGRSACHWDAPMEHHARSCMISVSAVLLVGFMCQEIK